MTDASPRGEDAFAPQGPETSRIRSVCVYCGSARGVEPAYEAAAAELGRAIAEDGLELVYGGGGLGLMGAAARSAVAAGGAVTGIIPEFLHRKEGMLAEISQTIVAPDMHTRKRLMYERADAFVALPGGIGTVEEIVEIMTWAQLGRHRKPIVYANVNGFWNPMLSLLDHMRKEGFVHTSHLVQPIVVDDPREIVGAILAHAPDTSSGDQSVIERM